MLTQEAFLERILPYVPPYWARQALADPARSLVGREDCFRAAVLFVDISGFTPLTEALSQSGPQGIEELSNLLGRYFEAMSEPVVALGGEIFKFAGDSLIVLFYSDGEELYLGSALECALRMQQAVREFGAMHTLAGLFSLQIKAGISEGPVYTTTVGDESGGMQPVLAGRALVRAMRAERVAKAGEIVVDAMLTSRLPGHVDIREARGTFRLVSGARDVPVLPAAQPLDRLCLASNRVDVLVQRLRPYLAAQVLERIEQGDRAVLCEHRFVTTMFVRFGGLELDRVVPGRGGAGGTVPLSRCGRLLQKYVVTMRDCIHRHGGRLNEIDFTADGGTLVAIFGAPTAQENDELSAVLCAWEMRQELARVLADLKSPPGCSETPKLHQCMSVCSGTVFVGDVGARARRTYATVGDGVNLASRLVGLAQWGDILVTEPVRLAAEQRFVVVRLGEREIRGKAEPVPLARIVEPRLQDRDDSPLTRLLVHPSPFGRASELAVLDDVRERAWAGESHLVQIVGQAGVGKSCLTGQLAHRWLSRGGRVLAVESGSGKYVGSHRLETRQRPPYGLWLSVIRRVLGVQVTDAIAQQRRCIRRQLATLALPADTAAYLETLALAGVSDLQGLVDDPQRLHRAVVDLLEAASARQPTLLIFEDLDRADDASCELLGDLLCDSRIARSRRSTFLVCITGRPTDQPDLWVRARAGESSAATIPGRVLSFQATRMLLEPLSAADSHRLAAHLTRKAGLDSELLPVLLRRSEGNPLFIQELIRKVARAKEPVGAATRQDQKRLEDRSSALLWSAEHSIPERVAHVIQAHLDPLSEELKLTLRLAAVIGRSFSFPVLLAAHSGQLSVTTLARRLAKLERLQIVCLSRVGPAISPQKSAAWDSSEGLYRDLPNLDYRFRHSMTQQVLYASLLRADLERFHQAVGYAIEDIYSSDLDAQYERLAEHFSRGRALVRAVAYDILAGRGAVKARAVREALTHYDRADEMLQAYRRDGGADMHAWLTHGVRMLGVSGENRSASRCVQGVRLSLVLERARVLLHLLEIAKAKDDLEQAVALAAELADLRLQGKALFSLAEILFHEANYGQAMAVTRRAELCFVALGDGRRQARACKLQSRIHAALGQPDSAVQCAERACLDGTQGMAYKRYLCSVFLQSSPPATGQSKSSHPSQPSTAQWSLTIEEPMWLALVAAYRGDWGRGLELARDAIAAGWALGTPLDVADAKWVLACILTRIGAFAEAGSHLDEAMAAYLEAGWKRGQISGLVLKGKGLIGLGQKRQANACLEQALAYAKEARFLPGIVGAQTGLGSLSASYYHRWDRAERLCVEARARARRACLGVGWVEAQLGLAQIYLAQKLWAKARTQAAQASMSSKRLGFRDLVLESAVVLGQAWLGLGKADCARDCLENADAVKRELAGTLPPAYASCFLERGSEVGRG